MAYRDDAAAREARIAAVSSELAALEAELERQRAAGAAIVAADRDRGFGWLRVLRKPGMLLLLVVALLGGVYVGRAFHVVDVYNGGPCTDSSGSAEHP